MSATQAYVAWRVRFRPFSAASSNEAKSIANELRVNFVRVEADYSTNKINGKIQDAEKAKVRTMLVIGPRDMEAGNVSVRLHSKGPQGAKPKGEVLKEILEKIRARAA